MSDPSSFEENENIVMNIHEHPSGSKMDHGNRGSNFFQIKLDMLGDQRKFIP
jgi:hypothetical protein